MAMKGAPLILGAGGVAAASAVAWLGLQANPPPRAVKDAPAAAASKRREADPNAKICLLADIGLAEARKGQCYERRTFAALADSPVRDDEGKPVSVSLSHPTDFERDPSTATTCAQYRGLVESGWYALTTAEMRREAYFERACGVLSMLERARAPEVSHFSGDRMSASDVASLADGPPFRIGADAATDAASEPATVGGGDNGVWTLSAGGQAATVQEIAHADFNADGMGDMLVFVRMSVEGGTATAAEVGIVEKKSAEGPCAYAAAN